MYSIVKYCFPFFPISQLLRGTCRTDLFVKFTNLTKGNMVWAHFIAIGYYPTSIRISRPIPKEKVHRETTCFCFKKMYVDWENTVVTGMSGIEIEIPIKAKVSIFTDNDLMTINDDHFEINLVAQLLNQMYIVPVPPPRYDYYDDTQEGAATQLTPSTSTGTTALAPPFLAQLISCAIANHYLWHDCHFWWRRHLCWCRHCRQKLTSSSVPI